MTEEGLRQELKTRFPNLPIRLVQGVIYIGEESRIDAINSETLDRAPSEEVLRFTRIVCDLLKSGWTPARKAGS